MFQFIQANPWALSVPIAILAICVTFYSFKKNYKTKIIDYVIESDIDLLSKHATAIEDLHIEFRGRTLIAPRIVTIKFVNVGNTAIVAEDYADDIQVFHGDITRPSTPLS